MKYIFFGKVHPERAPITTPSLHGTIGASDVSFNGTINVSIIHSQIVVELDTDEKFSATDLRNTVENFVHTVVDVYGYLKGYAYTVEISSVYIPETGKQEVLGIDIVKITNDEKNRPLNYTDTLQLALKEPELRMVLKDLRDAMKRPHDTFFHCKRATDTIAKHFTASNKEKKTDWPNMKKILGLANDELELIQNISSGQRHGMYASVEGEKRVDIMMRTWKVVDKFILYLKDNQARNK